VINASSSPVVRVLTMAIIPHPPKM